jgi:hypothetical protein
MKHKFLIWIAAISFLVGGSSCNYLDYQPDDYLTMEMIFNDQIRTQDWLASVYSSVPKPLWGYDRDAEGWNVMGDDITIPFEWSQFGWGEEYAYILGNWNPTSWWDANYWTELPRRIRTGFIFLENVKVLPGTDQNEENVERMKNEVRFLIAYYYSLLLEVYGPIPFSPGLIPVDAPSSSMMLTQTPYDDVVDWVEKELKEVSKKLPAVYDDNSYWGRATSVIALAERARMLLSAASPLFNGNEDFKDWKNSEDVPLFKSGSPDIQKWVKAAEAHKELIEAAHAAGYELYKEYNDDGSIDPFMSYYNVSLKTFPQGNKEIIFARPEAFEHDNVNGNNGLGWWQAHHLQKGIGGNAGMGVTQELVDAFYMKNGIAPITGYNPDGSPIINPASGYVENGFSIAPDIRNTKWKGGEGSPKINGQVALEGTYNMYCNREPRFYVSVIFNNAWITVQNRATNFLQGGRDTGLTFDAPLNGYNIRKKISLDVYPTQGIHPHQPGIIYRLAEAYLGYAEALNESNPGNADIVKYVNLVRERAGIPGLPSGMSQADMREAIRHERRVEFNYEGIRFNDIRRWKIGEETLNVPMYGMNYKGSKKSDNYQVDGDKAYYVRTFYKQRVFDKKQYIWPVPQAQIDINPNLSQAPGY